MRIRTTSTTCCRPSVSGGSSTARGPVATISRGEGGGNAAGREEGPGLGRLREDEERRAVGRVGVDDVHNLDEADLYYTVSAPLTEQAWKHDDVLGKVVRIVRQTRPEVVATMDPAPTPSNHGNHQYAGRLALEAYRVAGDPSAFPEQITDEGLQPWSAQRVVSKVDGSEHGTGAGCEGVVNPPDGSGRSYRAWGGRWTPQGDTWAQRERVAERDYVSQGWSSRPDLPDDPARIGCDELHELANGAPHPPGADGPDAALLGAALPAPGGLPLDTGLEVTADRPQIVPGKPERVRVDVTAPREAPLPAGEASLDLPEGWRAEGDPTFGSLAPGQRASVEFLVTAPENQPAGPLSVPARVVSAAGSGADELRWDVVPPVLAEQAPLPAVAEFRDWAVRTGFPELAGSVPPVQTVPAGGSRPVETLVHNYDREPHSGAVQPQLPQGFSARGGEQLFHDLEPGGTRSLTFDVTSTDPGMPTGARGGDHHYALAARGDGGESRTDPALELVPDATIPRSRAEPVVDGKAGSGEYPGAPIDVSAPWQGSCDSAEDCSASARLSWRGDALHAFVDVTDDRSGTQLPPGDCKRHWRTDAVELAVDPAGRSENTSSTFKLGVLPSTDDPAAGNPACYERDADNRQGSGERMSPGTRVASQPRPGGYTVEMAVPLADLPGGFDPRNLGLNLLVYDSDTQDKSGQTRLGWSAWEGVQGDPYRWGRARLEGREPSGQPWDPPPAALPATALSSVDAKPSVEQALRSGTALGGAPPAGEAAPAVVEAEPASGEVRTCLATRGPGTAHVYVVDESGAVLGDARVDVTGRGEQPVPVRVREGVAARVLVGFVGEDGRTAASSGEVG